ACALPPDANARALGAVADEPGVEAGARGEALRAHVQRLEQVRLADPVRAHREHQPGLERQLQALVGAELAQLQLADDQPASRMGMIRYQNASPSAVISPGRSGLISFRSISSDGTDSSPSRRKSALKPISSGSPVYATGSVSRVSPTSWLCADTVSSPSPKR